jgi:hypothetical protein
MAQVIEYLSSKGENLSSNPSTTKKQKKRRHKRLHKEMKIQPDCFYTRFDREWRIMEKCGRTKNLQTKSSGVDSKMAARGRKQKASLL